MRFDVKSVLRSLRGPTKAEREYAYLAGSADLYDLEIRQREIDRGRFGTY